MDDNLAEKINEAVDILYTFNHPEWPNLTYYGQPILPLMIAWAYHRVTGRWHYPWTEGNDDTWDLVGHAVQTHQEAFDQAFVYSIVRPQEDDGPSYPYPWEGEDILG